MTKRPVKKKTVTKLPARVRKTTKPAKAVAVRDQGVPDFASVAREMALSTSPRKIKAIHDQAIGMEEYAKRARKKDLLEYAVLVRYEACRNLGRLIREMQKRGELIDASGGRPKKEKNGPSGVTVKTLKDLGFSKNQSSKYQWMLDLPRSKFDHHVKSVVENLVRSLDAVFRQASDDKRRKALHSRVKVASGLHVGDFRELSPGLIADESVELVFTDPPYDRDSLPLYGAAAKEAARILKPGGSMLIYSGGLQLPEEVAAMCQHLEWCWPCGSLHLDHPNQMIRLGIENRIRLILWFVKGYRGDTQTFVSDVVTGERQKDVHDWQQHVEDAEYYIEKLTIKGGTVVDFCVGSGTTLVAAQKLGRQWIGFEIDKDTAKAASERLRSHDVEQAEHAEAAE
jgi:hypothetical protein